MDFGIDSNIGDAENEESGMCGIVGFVYKNKEKAAEHEKIKEMAACIVHRGPDAEGIYVEGPVALGHRRLSILDLSASGNQPMLSGNGQYRIVFNGEIYNYIELKNELIAMGARFSNQTDTEVILEAYRIWGTECVKHFNGMWSFCIYDNEKDIVFLSRDRFGVKPLYFLSRGDVFVFASEAKAILAAFPEENMASMDMVYRFIQGVPEDRDTLSFYKNIKIFQRAGCMTYSLRTGEMKEWLYWDVDEKAFYDRWIQGKDPLQTFKNLIEDAVKIRLRADVEVGACLSGGLDSSTIVGICSKKYGVKMHTFSSIYADKDCDEKEYIDLVNQFNDTCPHLIYPDHDSDDLIQAFKNIIYHHDGPNYGASLYSQYSVMKGIHGHVKVVLDGQGADELFGGYIPYYAHRLMDVLAEGGLRAKLRAIQLITILKIEWPTMFSQLHSDILFEALGEMRYKKLRRKERMDKNIESSGSIQLFTEEFLSKVDRSIAYREKNISGFLNTRLCKDLVRDSIPALLHNEDGNAMAFSIESRLPFLDYRIVEFALALDGKYKIKNEWTKWIIRESCKEYLPPKVAKRKNKMGFPAPFARWLRECSEKEAMKEIIYALGKRKIVPLEAIDFYYTQHIQHGVDYSAMLYKFLVLELWLRDCNDSIRVS